VGMFSSITKPITSTISKVPGGSTALGVAGSIPGMQSLGTGSFLGGLYGPKPVMGGGGAPVTTQPYSPYGTGTDGSFDIQSFLRSNPAYQFLQEEGIRGLERSAAAKGEFGSGNLMRDLTSFSSGLASQAYSGEMDRIMKMAGVGAGSPGTAGQVYGQQAGAGTGFGQEAYGSLGGIFDLFL